MLNEKEKYWMSEAKEASALSDCGRTVVGVILVDGSDNPITVATNTSIYPTTCLDEGECLLVDNHCIRTMHAEVKAIGYAAKNGHSLNGGTMMVYYETKEHHDHHDYDGHAPHVCPKHLDLIQECGITRVCIERVEDDEQEIWEFDY